MPYKRVARRFRSPYTRRPLTGLRRRRPIRLRRKLALQPRTHNFSRFTNDSVLINSGNTGDLAWSGAPLNWDIGAVGPDDNGLYQFGGSMKFQLSDIVDPSDFTTLFDRYKLNKVIVYIMPLTGSVGYVENATTGNIRSSAVPTILYAIDYDDAQIPGASQILLERQNCKSRRLNRTIAITINNPKMLSVVQQGDPGTTTQVAAATKTGYLDCAQDDVNHFGLKFYMRDFAIPADENSINTLVRIRCKYFFSFKESK